MTLNSSATLPAPPAHTACPHLASHLAADTSLVDELSELLRLGLLPRPEVLTRLRRIDTEAHREDALAHLLDQAWTARLLEEEAWERSDADRLDEALEALTAAGIVSRIHHECCDRCGYDALRAEEIPGARGYAMSAAPDTEAVLELGVIHLSYGPLDPGEDETWSARAEAIAQEVCEVLAAVDLETEWDGTANQRITVLLPDWRRRLPT